MNRNPLLILTAVLMITTVQFILMGLLAELLVRTYHESQNRPTYVIKEVLEARMAMLEESWLAQFTDCSWRPWMSTAPRKKENRGPKTGTGQRSKTSTAWIPQSAIRNPRLLVVLCLIIFAGIPFVLGKYFELKYPDPFDSGSYVYSAQHVLSGARIGYDEKPSAQAGTLLVNMLGVKLTGYNEIGSKLLQGLFQVAALTLMFLTIRRLYGISRGRYQCNRRIGLSVCPGHRQVRQRQRAVHDRPDDHGRLLLRLVPAHERLVVGCAHWCAADRRPDVQADGRLCHRRGRAVRSGSGRSCTTTLGRTSARMSCCWWPVRSSL